MTGPWNPLQAKRNRKLDYPAVHRHRRNSRYERIPCERKELVVQSLAERDKQEGQEPSAGIQLLRELRARHLTMLVVFYHRSSDDQERRAGRDLALSEGAFGEVVTPNELFGLVTSALGVH